LTVRNQSKNQKTAGQRYTDYSGLGFFSGSDFGLASIIPSHNHIKVRQIQCSPAATNGQVSWTVRKLISHCGGEVMISAGAVLESPAI